jgi:hypothetical protein
VCEQCQHIRGLACIACLYKAPIVARKGNSLYFDIPLLKNVVIDRSIVNSWQSMSGSGFLFKNLFGI